MVALQPHTFPRSLLRRLCAGDDDLGDLSRILRGRLSKNALHPRIIRDAAAGTPEAEQFRAHLAAFTELQRTHPGAVTDVLTGPHFGAWAAHCVGRLASRTWSDDGMPLAVDLGHLGCFVGAAAIRAGADIAVTVPVHDGAVVLPATGRVLLPATLTPDWATLRCRAGRVRVETAGFTGTDWQPLATMHGLLASGRRWGVTVDAADPYLRFVQPAHDDAIDISRWSRRFGSACAVIDGLYSNKATAMARSISCLIPVARGGDGIGLSATSAPAAGAIALTEPSSDLGLAATLVHEHQHLKLNALHDLVPLFTEAGAGRYYSPWRNDPRPASGLLHGAYAFLGLGEFWFRICVRPSTSAQRGPQLELARITRQLDLACDTLAGCTDLTAVGAELVEHLIRSARRWRAHAPPPDVARVADDVVVEHQVRWRLHNLAPPAAEIRLAAERVGSGVGPRMTEPAAESAPPAYGTDGGLSAAATRWAAGEQPASIVDRLILEGRYGLAQSLLVARIRAGADLQDWVALAVVARHTDLTRRCPPLRTHPELAYALYRELRRRRLPTNLATVARALSGWLRYIAGTSISLSVRM